jgi:hypothetical protein
MVLHADKVRRRISLSLRQLHGGGPEVGDADYTPPKYDFPEDDDDEESDSAPVAVAIEAVTESLTDEPATAPDGDLEAPESSADEAATIPPDTAVQAPPDAESEVSTAAEAGVEEEATAKK